ncbi:MAG: hypothetical protein Q7R44_00095, partial [bacterium]|nr:hypothetical protein [bacterium]
MPQAAPVSPGNTVVSANGGSTLPQGGLSAQTGSLVDILLSLGALNGDEALKIKSLELQTGKSQEDLLSENGTVSEENLAKAKATFYNVPFVNLEQTSVSPEALSLLPQSVASRFSVVPISIDREKNQLLLAMAQPLDLTAIEFVEQKSGMRVRPAAAVPSEIERLIAERYAVGLTQEVTEAIKQA